MSMQLQPSFPTPGVGVSGAMSPSQPPPAPYEQILLHLDERGFVPFHPALSEKFGHKAAIFVGMALYWTRHNYRKHPDRGGWFHMSMTQWRNSIGLTRTEQESVREALMEVGVLEEFLVGRPAVMNYRINVAALAKELAINQAPNAPLNWDNAQSWFRGCHSYYKPLTDVVGNIAAGLYLSFLLQRHRDCLKRGQLDNGCIAVTQDLIAEHLHLGVKVQRNARDRLKRAGLIQESGPGGSLVRVNMDAVLMCLRGQATKPLKGRAAALAKASAKAAPAPTKRASNGASSEPGVNLSGLGIAFSQLSFGMSSAINEESKPKVTRPRDLLLDFLNEQPPVEIRQVNTAHPAQSVATFDSEIFKRDRALLRSAVLIAVDDAPPAKFAVSCKLESAQTCNQELPKPASYIQRDVLQRDVVNTTTTASCSGGFSSSPKIPEDAASLVLPDNLTGLHTNQVLDVLSGAPASEHQRLLDELCGQMRNKTIHKPAGWLFGLIRKMQSGPLVLTYADGIAADRLAAAYPRFAPEQVNPRFAQHQDLQEALRLIQPGFVYRLDLTGTLVVFDQATGNLRGKRTNDSWRVLLNGGPIVQAHREGKLSVVEADEHPGELS